MSAWSTSTTASGQDMLRRSLIGWSSPALPKHPPEDLVHIPQRTVQIEGALQRFSLYLRGDFRIAHDQLAEIQVFLPRLHRVRLHQPVSVFAQHAGLDQVEQQ